MSKTFIIADLHGRADLLKMAIERIEAGHPNGGTIVFTGDYVDRGFESKEVLDILMAGPSDPERWAWICLQGNHELIMTAGCLHGETNWWVRNGGGATLLSFGQKNGEVADPGVVPRKYLQWVASLPVTYRDKHRLFVHAGVDPTIPLEDQSEHDMQWMLYPGGIEDGHGDYHVVHGHHQHQYGPMLYKGRSNFDTLAWATGRLVVGVFDDDVPGGPVATIEIQGRHFDEVLEEFRSAA